jgi:FkbM family methyltransferase
MARVTYFYREMSEYIQIDLDLLRERHELTVVECRSRWPRPLRLLRLIASSDVVMSWFASWHSLFPAIVCRLLGRPMVLTVGGYDTATGSGSGYGAARGWFKRLVTRVTVRLATRLVVVSQFARREAMAAGAAPAKLVVGPHGLDPARYADPGVAREDLAITVGGVNTSNLARKGLEPFVRAAARLPQLRFIVVGAWMDDAVERLRAIATPNVTFTGAVSHEDKVAWLWRACVVVQASRHEAFGLSLAEGMLCGAIPVVTNAGALPEVVGDAGVVVASQDPDAIADGIRRALGLGADGSRQARERVLGRFTIDQRRALVHGLVEHATRRASGSHNRALHHLIERQVRPGGVCMDVGADLGEVTRHLAARVGRAGRVYAFEPAAMVHDQLLRHVEHNGVGDVVDTFRVALSDRAGTGAIRHAGSQGDDQGAGPRTSIHAVRADAREVPLVTLDEFVERHGIRRLDFMRIDLRGAALLLLEGGRKTLATLSPDLLIEVAPQESRSAWRESRGLCVKLEELGYRLYRLNGHGLGAPIDARTVPADFKASNVFCVKQAASDRPGGDRRAAGDARAPLGRRATGSPHRDPPCPNRSPALHGAPPGESEGSGTTMGPSRKENRHVAARL